MIIGTKRNNKKSRFIADKYLTNKQLKALQWYEERRSRDKQVK